MNSRKPWLFNTKLEVDTFNLYKSTLRSSLNHLHFVFNDHLAHGYLQIQSTGMELEVWLMRYFRQVRTYYSLKETECQVGHITSVMRLEREDVSI